MSNNILSIVINTHKSDNKLPNWAKNKNRSGEAFLSINNIKERKLKYIHSHKLIKDFRKKSNYQISISELARSINTAVTTLSSTSSYSDSLMKYLKSVNTDLEKEKNNSINKHEVTRSKGTKQKKKEAIRQELNKVKLELDITKKKNALDQASFVLKHIPLPIKRTLGMDC